MIDAALFGKGQPTIEFWPNWPDTFRGFGTIQPNVVVTFGSWMVIIEAKLWSGKSWVPGLDRPADEDLAKSTRALEPLGAANLCWLSWAALGSLKRRMGKLESWQRINPFRYLRDVLVRVQAHPQSHIDGLLPQRWAERFAVDSS
jgi:hypothetical protein